MKYLEHRVVFTGSTIIRFPEGETTISIDTVGHPWEGRFSFSCFSQKVPGNPYNDFDQAEKWLAFEPDEPTMRTAEGYFCPDNEATLTSLTLKLTDLGFLNVFLLFDIPDGTTPAECERLSKLLFNRNTEALKMYHELARNVARHKLISIPEKFESGIPTQLLQQGRLNGVHSALADIHFFLSPENGDIVTAFTDYFKLTRQPESYFDNDLYTGWASYVWVSDIGENGLDRILELMRPQRNILETCCICYMATTCYTECLHLVAYRRTCLAQKIVTQMISSNRFVFQSLQLQKAWLSETEGNLLDALVGKGDFSTRIELYGRAEDALNRAMQGIRDWKSGRSSIIIQTILNIFVILSVYSIANDFFGLAQIQQVPSLTSGDISSQILLLLTSLVVLIGLLSSIVFYRNKS